MSDLRFGFFLGCLVIFTFIAGFGLGLAVS